MEDPAHHINQKNIIHLARNRPVAVIVGGAGFLGSHLIDHFLRLKIQVLAIDDLSTGRSENLYLASQDDNFYFVKLKIESDEAQNVLNGLPRLDYAFFMAKNDKSEKVLVSGLNFFLEAVNYHHLRQIREHRTHSEKPKILFRSSIELYDNKLSHRLQQLQNAEIYLAKYAREKKLNTRIVRMGEVFGPRMNLNRSDVFSRLIKAVLEGNLVGENPAQEFSTRALYIDDAVNLFTKAMLLSASANKIFDGVEIKPLKVEEIKQILLDPNWYEQSDFKFTELPPWETPNLKSTIRELSWKPRANIITALKETLHYFSLHPNVVEDETVEKNPKELIEIKKEEILTEVEPIKAPARWSFKEIDSDEITESPQEAEKSIWPIFKFLVIWVIILLGLVYPLFVLIAGNFILPNSLKKAEGELITGNFKMAEQEISLGYLSAREQDNIVSSLAFLRVLNLFSPQIDQWRNISKVNVESFQDTQQTIDLVDKFVANLEQGNLSLDSINQFNLIELENERNLADSLAKISSSYQTIWGKVDKEALQNFYSILIQTKQAEQILPDLLSSSVSGQGSESTKKYLVILQDSLNARPTGGIIKDLSLVKVGNGKVVDVLNLSLEELDKKLPTNLSPDDLTKANLNISNLRLSNSNFDPDYPTFAKTFEQLYIQAGGAPVDGVLSIDSKAAGGLLEALDGINLVQGEKITTKEEVAVLIDGSDLAKKDQLLKQLLVKTFGVSRQNVFKVGQKLSQALNQKDILVFVNDQNLENKFINNGWSGILSGLRNNDTSTNDLIAMEVYDFNGASALKREFNDQITIDEQGAIQHNLTAKFTEQGNRVFNGEIMVYLPLGIKVDKISLGTSDLTGKTSQYIKHGLTGMSFSLIINPGENQDLVLSYQLPTGLNLGQGSSTYKYRFVKQPGTGADPLVLIFNYPEGIQVSDNLNPDNWIINGKQIQTNLLEDRKYQFVFKK